MDAEDLHALHRQAERDADGRIGAVGLLVADQLAQKALSRVARPAAGSPARGTRRSAPSARCCARAFCRSRCRDRGRSARAQRRPPSVHRAVAADIRALRPPRRRNVGLSCIVCGVPCMCITHTPAPVSAASVDHLRIARQAGDVVDDLRAGVDRRAGDGRLARVDRNRNRRLAATSRSITGSTRRSSSSADTGSAYGRVLSPPMSSMSAPSATSCSAWATAASAIEELPAVGKAVRRDIDDAHHQRPPRQLERASAQSPSGLRVRELTCRLRTRRGIRYLRAIGHPQCECTGDSCRSNG